MTIGELMGASVEVAPAGFDVRDPLLDVRFPYGERRLVADRERAILYAEAGTFAIAEGSQIRVEPADGVPASTISVWLHGWVAAFLLAQRGRFALHASVVDIGGTAVAVAGASRTGKSTTALRLTQRGHTLVTDDVSPLSTEPDVTVHPFTRPLHVWPDAAAALGLELSGAEPVVPGGRKLSLPVASGASVPVGAVAVLRPLDAAAAVDTARVNGARAHHLVRTNTSGGRLLSGPYGAEIFAWAAAVSANLPVHVVTRPAKGWTVDAVADAVERIAAEGSR